MRRDRCVYGLFLSAVEVRGVEVAVEARAHASGLGKHNRLTQ